MPSDSEHVIHQLTVGSAAIAAEIVERAHTSDDVSTVIAAALFALDDQQWLMDRADALAVTTKERQLVQIATAHLHGDADRVEDLARDHLADHPDSVLVAWIISANSRTNPRTDPTRTEHP